MTAQAAGDAGVAGLEGLEPPRLLGFRLAVSDPESAAAYFSSVLGLTTAAGPWPGCEVVALGAGHGLVLAPGGSDLPVLHDRHERHGVIPILRSADVDALVATLDGAGAEWVNRPRDYEMMGTGRIGYVHVPDHHVLGIQQRLADSTREEDVAFERARVPSASSRSDVRGVGWTIFQVADLAAARRFYARAFGWGERRGSHLGSMMAITETTILQTWLEGVAQDPQRDLAAEPVLPLLTGDAGAIAARAVAIGGRAGIPLGGAATVLDHEGHAWAILTAAEAVAFAASIA